MPEKSQSPESLLAPLSGPEKNFLRKGWAKNSPAPFMVHHIWICRVLDIDPVWDELDKITEHAQKFIIDDQ